MRHLHLSISLALLLSATAAFADTAERIVTDYRKQAVAALAKVNETLEKATVPIAAELVKSGETATADQLRDQVKAKAEGEPVDQPLTGVTSLFKSYEAARAKALEPVQKSALSRIDAMLASSDGKKMDIVTALGQVRDEITSGKVSVAMAGSNIESKLNRTKWSWGMTLESAASTLTFGPRKTLQVNQDVQHNWRLIDARKIKWDDDTIITFTEDIKTFEAKMPNGSLRHGKLIGKVEG